MKPWAAVQGLAAAAKLLGSSVRQTQPLLVDGCWQQTSAAAQQLTSLRSQRPSKLYIFVYCVLSGKHMQ